MWIAVVNNLPEMALGLCWTGVFFWIGRCFERWKASRTAR